MKIEEKKQINEQSTPFPIRHRRKAAILSALLMGVGQVYNKEWIKAIFFGVIGIVSIIAIPYFHHGLWGIITLGEVPGPHNDHSIVLMIQGLISILVLLILVTLYILNIRDAWKTGRLRDQGEEVPAFKKYISQLWDESFPYIMLSPAVLGIMFFVLLPILFGICIAFTNYSMPHHIPPKNLVDWVGFENFINIAKMPMWSNTFLGVATWTVIFAILATTLNFFGGLFVAALINSRYVHFKKFWRSIYILPYAVPAMISQLIFRNMFNGQFGPINMALKEWGIIKNNIPWLSDPFLAKVTILIINIWLGFPYFMALMTGIMTSISKEIYEAADIDGASSRQKFNSITLPMVLYSTAPLLIMSFSFNFNNFGLIYFLTDGGPTGKYPAGSGAGATDILISWVYKLTLNTQQYHMASVMSLIIFVVIGSIAAYNYTRTKSFKEEGML